MSGYYDVQAEPAASVIPVRQGQSRGMEIYLTRRQSHLMFLGGCFVFPGGKVDRADNEKSISDLCMGIAREKAAAILGAHPDEAIGYWIAGIRELFEEAGLLLAYDSNGRFIDYAEANAEENIDKLRTDLHDDRLSFRDFLARTQLKLAADKLFYLSRWVTPIGSSRRFDTRFFVAEAPAGQEPQFHEAEISEGLWIAADKAVKLAEAGKLEIILPTYICIKEVAEYKSLESLFEGLAKKNPR